MRGFLCIAAAIALVLAFFSCDDSFTVITGDTAHTADTFAESTACRESDVAASSPKATQTETAKSAAQITNDTTESESSAAGQIHAGLTVMKFTSPATRNSNATLTLRGAPNTEYRISVIYSSGASSAKGLESKFSDGDGMVSWTWKIGGKVKSGKYKVTVSGGGTVANFTLEVK